MLADLQLAWDIANDKVQVKLPANAYNVEYEL
jgi:hypothetical protein